MLSVNFGQPPSKLVYLSVAATDHDCHGNEPVYHGDQIVGLTTGGAYGDAVKQSLAFAYVEPGLAQPGAQLEMLMMDDRCPAIVLPGAAWDPDNTRLKA